MMMKAFHLLLATACISAGCGPATGPSGVLEPLVWTPEPHLTLEWQAAPRGSATSVWGYVVNRSPYNFDRVQVLVDALGPAGELISQRVVWAPGLLGGFGRNYFEATIDAAHAYRVRVYSYQRVELDGPRRWPF